jgi:hypothetical protein
MFLRLPPPGRVRVQSGVVGVFGSLQYGTMYGTVPIASSILVRYGGVLVYLWTEESTYV